MKTTLLFLFFLHFFSSMSYCIPSNEKKIIHTKTKNIEIIINGKKHSWTVLPQIKLDKLQYISKERNNIKIISDTDTSRYETNQKDTLLIVIVLNKVDTAKTAIIGINEYPNQISDDDKIYWLSKIWSEMKYNFVNVDAINFNMDSLYKSSIAEIRKTNNDYEFYRSLQKFCASFNDGHTQVISGSQFYAFHDYVPITMTDIDKKIYIEGVRKTPESDSTWVGAQVIKIEGMPTQTYIEQKMFPYISASTMQHKWMQAVHKIHSGFYDQTLHLVIKKSSGEIENIELKYNGEASRSPKDENWGKRHNFSRKIVDLKWHPNKIAQICFNKFHPTEKAIQEFQKILEQIKSARGVVIDLRKNGGGSTKVAQYLQKHLSNENHFLNYSWETRINDAVKKANGNWITKYEDFYLEKAYRFCQSDTIYIEDTIEKIKIPTVILTSRFTFSAAEDFLVNLYEQAQRPLIVGQETGGSTGSPLVISDLPGGGYVRICTRRICYPYSGKRFINQGVKPDIEIKETIEDYLSEKDKTLEKGIELINQKLNSPSH